MFELSDHSILKLQGVHPELVNAVALAIKLSDQDFAVLQGLRTDEEQAKAVATGHSKTLHSRHLTGHAVDLVPFVDGKLSWDWNYFPSIVTAMKKAGAQLGVKMNWGGCWDRELDQLGIDPEAERHAYVQREIAKGNHEPLQDGPHFQLTYGAYPCS